MNKSVRMEGFVVGVVLAFAVGAGSSALWLKRSAPVEQVSAEQPIVLESGEAQVAAGSVVSQAVEKALASSAPQEVHSESLISMQAAPEEEQETLQSATRRVMGNFSKMMENPGMNQMMVASQRGVLDVMYADLVNQFDLNDEERDYFMDLLLSRQMKAVEVGMKMMPGGLSAEEKAELEASVKENRKMVRREIKKFLNDPDDFAEWKFYEKTVQDRMMLTKVEQELDAAGAPLTDQSYRQLLQAIYETRSGFEFSSDLAQEENMDMTPERFSDENIANLERDLLALAELIVERAGTILSEDQLLVFQQSQQAGIELQLSQLKMAKQMFGGK